MVDGSRSFFSNKWRHYNNIAIAKSLKCVSQLLHSNFLMLFILFNTLLFKYFSSWGETSMEFGFFK